MPRARPGWSRWSCGRRPRRGLASAADRPSGSAGPRVVAVLPFKNLGPPGDQYFADGLTEEITSRLAGLSGLRVISRTSADQYRASRQSVRAIGAELGADYVLEGSVRWARDSAGVGRLRVTPQLIRVGDDSHLWAATYEAALGEVFRLQSEIAERVTTALDVALRAPERRALAMGGTAKPEAYDFYLRGNEYLGRGTEQPPTARRVDLFRAGGPGSTPTFAAALAKLAGADAAIYWYHYDRTPARLDGPSRRRMRRGARPPTRREPCRARLLLYWGELDYDARAARVRGGAPQPAGQQRAAPGDRLRRAPPGSLGHGGRAFREALAVRPGVAATPSTWATPTSTLPQYPEASPARPRHPARARLGQPLRYKAMLYLIWRATATAREPWSGSDEPGGTRTARPGADDCRRHLGLVLTADSSSSPRQTRSRPRRSRETPRGSTCSRRKRRDFAGSAMASGNTPIQPGDCSR